MEKYIRLFIAAALFTLIAACGGGSSSSSSSSTAQFPLDSAISAFLQMNNNYILHANNNGDIYTLQIGWSFNGTHTFMATSADSSLQGETLTEDGIQLANESQLEYFLLGPYKPLGSDQGIYAIASHQVALPAMAVIGAFGPLYTATTYTDSTFTIANGSETVTWFLAPAIGSDASLCIDTEGTIGTAPLSEVDCYLLDTSGNVLDLQVQLLVQGKRLSFQSIPI